MNTTQMCFWLQGKIAPNWTKDYQNLKFDRAQKSQDRSIRWTGLSRYSDQQPTWLKDLIPKFNFDMQSWSINCMWPSTKISSKKPQVDNLNNILKITVFLEDWNPGNYCEFNGQTFVNWHAGSFIAVPADCEFLDCNFGHQSRYTVELFGSL
jgi:hypothetical protein